MRFLNKILLYPLLATAAGMILFALSLQSEKRWHLDAFRPPIPSERTKQSVQKNADFKVILFMEQTNPLFPFVQDYYQKLTAASPFPIEVTTMEQSQDAALRFRVTGNHYIALDRELQFRTIPIGKNHLSAKERVAKLDLLTYKTLTKLYRPEKTISVSTGHGEHTFSSTNQPLTSFLELRALLDQENLKVAPLPVLKAIPPNLLMLAPSAPLLPGEQEALTTWFAGERNRGLWCFEPQQPNTLHPDYQAVLQQAGLHKISRTLANEQEHIQLTGRISDRRFLFSQQFSEHPATSLIGNSRIVLPLLEVFSLEFLNQKPWKAKALVNSHPESFSDEDGTFTYDPELDPKRPFPVISALENTASGTKLLVSGDCTWLSDAFLRQASSQRLLFGVLDWLFEPIENQGRGDDTWFMQNNDPSFWIESSHKRILAWMAFLVVPFLLTALLWGLGRIKIRLPSRHP